MKRPKTSADFPLNWDQWSGQWHKMILGKRFRFGSDPQQALDKYYKHLAGVSPEDEKQASLTVRELVNEYLTHREADRDAPAESTEKITKRTFAELLDTGKVMAEVFGSQTVKSLKPLDFAKLRRRMNSGSPDRLRRRMTNVRSIFKWAFKNGLIDSEVKYGTEFDLATKSELRKAKANRQEPILDAATIRLALEHAWPAVKTFILLGLNCGYYSKDIAELRPEYIDGEFVDFARTKTGIERRCWLWPETREAIAQTRAHADNRHGRLFLSKRGAPLYVEHSEFRTDLIAGQWNQLKKDIGLKRENSGFKCFRHTFRTESGAARDPEAVLYVMGHTSGSVSEVYRHRFDDDRIVNVCQAVRTWLFEGAHRSE